MKSRRVAGPLFLLLIVTSFSMWLHGAVPDVPTGQWLAGPALAQPRAGAVSVMLDDGRVLVIGGRTADGPVDTVEVFGTDGTMSLGAQMLSARVGHTATKLPDGRVLVVGGTTLVTTVGDNGAVTSESATASAELFDPIADAWHAASSLSIARSGATATALPDGHVVVAGGTGSDGAALDTFEVFDSESGAFSSPGLLSAARTEHAATMAGPTKVLVAGGRNAGIVLATADVIDVASGGVTTVVLNAARAGATATTLLDGKILVAGGSDGMNELASTEVIDPASGLSAISASMAQARRDHQAVLLANNNTVLIAGGTSGGAVVSGAEQFIPWTGEFSVTGSPASSRASAVVSNLSKDGAAWLAAGRAVDGGAVAASEFYGFATLKTDKDDYPPGTTVDMSGAGWQPGERVTLVLHEVATGHADRTYYADADNGGRIANSDFVTDLSHMGVRFFLTARGASSQAQMTFTDAVSLQNVSATPSSLTVNQGSPAQYTVTVSFNGNGLTGCTATLSVSNLPSGATASWTPSNQVSATSGVNLTRTLNIATTTSTATGTFALTIQATAPSVSGGQGCNGGTVSTTAGLTVDATSVATTTTVASSANSSTFGQSVTFTATVGPASGSIAPTGSVQFTIDGVNFGSPVSVTPSGSNGVAVSGSTTALTVAGSPHAVVAEYTPTGSFNASTGTLAGGQSVNKANQTITFGALATRVYGDAPFTVSASASSGLAVSFAASGNCTVSGNTVTITGAGNCTITASQAGDGNYNAAPTVPQTFSIGKASATVVVTGYTGVYDGLAHGASGTATGVGGVSLTGLNLGASFANVPGGTASWTFTDATGNYNDAAGTATVVISKADATVTVNGYTGVYDANAHGATGTATGVGGVALVGLNLGASFTNVPGGTANWTFTDGGGNYNGTSGTAAIVINKADATVTVAGYTNVYDGAAHGATGSAAGIGGAALAGLDLGETFTNVPGGTASWTFADATGNYNNTSGTAAVVINKADATLVVSGYTGVYDAAAHGLLSSSATGVNSEALSGLVFDPATFTNVPGGSIPWSFTNANYADQNGVATVTITKAAAVVSVVGFSGVYDGAAHGATGTATGVLNETLSGLDLGASFTNVPGGTANWTFTDSTGNYNNATGTAPIVINKADPTVNVTGYTGVYDGAAHGATGSATGVLSETLSGLDLGTSLTNVPGGTVNWTFTDSTGNYNTATGTVAIVITKADATVTVNGYTGVFDGAPHGATGTAIGVGGVVLSGLDLGASFTNVPGGTATWTFTDPTGNYNNATGTAAIVITKADATVSVTGYTGAFDGSAHGATGTATGVGGAALSGLVLGDSFTNVPGGTATWTFTDPTGNYNNASGTAAIVINKAASTTTTAGDGPFTYDGTTHAGGSGTVTGAGGLSISATSLTYTGDQVNAGTYYVTAHYAGDANHNASDGAAVGILINQGSSTTTVTCLANMTYTGLELTPCTATAAGAGGLNQSLSVSYESNTNPGIATASATFAGDANHSSSTDSETFTIGYGVCSVSVGPGGVALPPINSDGTSVFARKGGSTIPVKFRVCDASGNPISNPLAVFAGTDGSLTMLSAVRGTIDVVNEPGIMEIPDGAFRFSGGQWIFNMATSNLTQATTYTFRINLAVGNIPFRVGVK